MIVVLGFREHEQNADLLKETTRGQQYITKSVLQLHGAGGS